MTRVAVANVQAPFLWGGAELLGESLVDELRARDVEAYLIRIPFAWNPPERIVDHILATRLLRLGNIDRLIPLKFPAYALPHENKVVWLLHQFRQAYDLWDTELQGIPSTAVGYRLRQTIMNADAAHLREAKRIYTNSEITRTRLHEYNGIASEVLYPPLIHPELYSNREAGDYVFCPSRISRAKRQDLIIEAMSLVKKPIRLVIAGPPDTPGDLIVLERLVAELDLGHRVTIMPVWISDEDKADLLADCLGCVYIPIDEDSYGYVTLESYQSRKPVVTCSDSGGTLRVVFDNETGFVVDPNPLAIADAIDRLASNRGTASTMGENGYEHVLTLGLSWDRVIEALLS